MFWKVKIRYDGLHLIEWNLCSINYRIIVYIALLFLVDLNYFLAVKIITNSAMKQKKRKSLFTMTPNDLLHFDKSHRYSWPCHRHPYQLLWSYRRLLHQIIVRPSLSWHGAIQLMKLIHHCFYRKHCSQNHFVWQIQQ